LFTQLILIPVADEKNPKKFLETTLELINIAAGRATGVREIFLYNNKNKKYSLAVFQCTPQNIAEDDVRIGLLLWTTGLLWASSLLLISMLYSRSRSGAICRSKVIKRLLIQDPDPFTDA
jgi:hypothetical protein